MRFRIESFARWLAIAVVAIMLGGFMVVAMVEMGTAEVHLP